MLKSKIDVIKELNFDEIDFSKSCKDMIPNKNPRVE
tara:strand:- start:1712 stop:1819 length:108 start_codon:yes stop_codon:yes gene_type:complete